MKANGVKMSRSCCTEGSGIVVLDSVEQVAVEEVEPQDDADLCLIDEDEKNNHRCADPPLQCGEVTKRPDAGPTGFFGVKVAVGDPHDLLDHAELCHQVDQN